MCNDCFYRHLYTGLHVPKGRIYLIVLLPDIIWTDLQFFQIWKNVSCNSIHFNYVLIKSLLKSWKLQSVTMETVRKFGVICNSFWWETHKTKTMIGRIRKFEKLLLEPGLNWTNLKTSHLGTKTNHQKSLCEA